MVQSLRHYYRNMLQLRADLWRIPFLMCLAVLLLFVITVNVDRAAARGAVTLPGWFSVGGADDARAILGAMLGAVSTVLALIFSIALLVLSMAVSQFGPRILHRFMRDGITQLTIGLFLASFIHSLLAFVVTRSDSTSHFVPQVTLLCSVLLTVVSFAFLVIFSHRIAVSIQTQNVVASIVADLSETLTQFLAERRVLSALPRTAEGLAAREELLARCTVEGGVVGAVRTGFIQEVNVTALVHVVDAADAVVRVLYRPGQFVMKGAPLFQVLPGTRAAELTSALRRTVEIGSHRTLKQDLEFGTAQLVEIALRALSPAVNDTFTGLTCIDWLGDELRVFATVQAPTGAYLGATGTIRAMWSPLRFERLIKTAFDQIRQAGMGNPAVSIRLLQTFARLAEQIEDGQYRAALLQQVEAVKEAVPAQALVTSDRADIEAAYLVARQVLELGKGVAITEVENPRANQIGGTAAVVNDACRRGG